MLYNVTASTTSPDAYTFNTLQLAVSGKSLAWKNLFKYMNLILSQEKKSVQPVNLNVNIVKQGRKKKIKSSTVGGLTSFKHKLS